MLSIQTHTCTHTWTYTPSLPPHFPSCAFRRLLGFLSGFLGCSWGSFPYPSQGLSIHFFLLLPFSLALLALLFLCFFLLFQRLFRYLFRSFARAPQSGTVCVSNPVPEGFPCFQSRGVLLVIPTVRNEATVWRGRGGLIIHLYLLQRLSTLRCSNPSFLIPCWFMIRPPNPFFPPPLCSCAYVSDCKHCSTIQFSPTFSPCRSLTIFDLGIELTENQCQSVNRSAVPLDCWEWSPWQGRWIHSGNRVTHSRLPLHLTSTFS